MGIPFFRKIDRQFCIVDFVPVHAVLFAGRNGADTNSINALLCKAYTKHTKRYAIAFKDHKVAVADIIADKLDTFKSSLKIQETPAKK